MGVPCVNDSITGNFTYKPNKKNRLGDPYICPPSLVSPISVNQHSS